MAPVRLFKPHCAAGELTGTLNAQAHRESAAKPSIHRGKVQRLPEG